MSSNEVAAATNPVRLGTGEPTKSRLVFHTDEGEESPADVVVAPTITTVPREAYQLVDLAVDGLVMAAHESEANARFTGAQLAALRAAAAVVAVRAHTSSQPTGLVRGRALNVWQLLSRVAPELSEWAALFHYSAERRTAVVAGTAAVTTREADDSLRDSATFVASVAARLGVPNRRLDVTAQWLAVT